MHNAYASLGQKICEVSIVKDFLKMNKYKPTLHILSDTVPKKGKHLFCQLHPSLSD